MSAPTPDGPSMQSEDERVAEALRFAGQNVGSVYDLVNSREAYPAAIPILLGLLPSIRSLAIREGVVRALSVKEARGVAVDPLIAEFEGIPFEGRDRDAEQLLKWAIGNALRVVAGKDDLPKLVRLVDETRHGHARAELVAALARYRSPEAVACLLRAVRDERVAGQAISALVTLKVSEALPEIRPYLTHSSVWLRKTAKKAVDRLVL